MCIIAVRRYPYYTLCCQYMNIPASRILNKLTRVQIISGGFASTILCIYLYPLQQVYMYNDVRNGGIWLIFISGGDEIASCMTRINYVF